MKTWIPSAIIYQVNLRSLAAREPRNAFEAAKEKAPQWSPLAYVTKNLRSLRKLGVTVIHMMPPFEMGLEARKGIGSPYAARDYESIDPEYGTMDEFKELITHAHQLGFKIIVGMVPNHTSRDHVWIENHSDYYVKNNDGQIIYDLDWSDTAKIDYTNRGLRDSMIAVYDFWLSVLGRDHDGHLDGVDGFRIDMAHFINDRSFWDEAIPQLREKHGTRELLFMAECYGTENSIDLFERGFNGSYDDGLYKMWENFYGLDEEGHSMILPVPGLADHNYFADKYQAFLKGGVAGAISKLLVDYNALEHDAYFARYTDNHDEGRGIFRFGHEAVRAMNELIFLTRRGMPFLLTGQEFAAANRPSIHERVSPCDKGCRILRNGEVIRREGVEFEGNIFARGYKQRQDWYAFYQTLIRLRLKQRALTQGSFELIDCGEQAEPANRTVVAFERKQGRTTLRCAINMGPDPRWLSNTSLFEGKLLYGTWNGSELPAFSAIVSKK